MCFSVKDRNNLVDNDVHITAYVMQRTSLCLAGIIPDTCYLSKTVILFLSFRCTGVPNCIQIKLLSRSHGL